MTAGSLQGVLGVIILVGLCVIFSTNRRAIAWRLLLLGLVIQFVIGLVVLKVPSMSMAFDALNRAVQTLQAASMQGSQFMFGYLAGASYPFEVKHSDKTFIIAFQVLPMIIVVSGVSAVLYHMRIIPGIIKLLAKVLGRTLGISSTLGLGATACIFFGTIEAPLLIKNYLKSMSKSDLLTLMTCSSATISGAVMMLYSALLDGVVEQPTAHLFTASVMSVPAAIILAKAYVPDDAAVKDTGTASMPSPYASIMDAFVQGIAEGLHVALAVAGLLIGFVAAVYLLDAGLALLPSPGDNPLSSTYLVSLMLQPFMWLIGIPWGECAIAAQLMAKKIILNEFIAYMDLAKTTTELSSMSKVILSYAFCGFANLGGLGVILGGLATILPERRLELSSLSLSSLVLGNFATMLTAAVIGIII